MPGLGDCLVPPAAKLALMQVGDKFNMTLARTLNKDGSSMSNVYDKVGLLVEIQPVLQVEDQQQQQQHHEHKVQLQSNGSSRPAAPESDVQQAPLTCIGHHHAVAV